MRRRHLPPARLFASALLLALPTQLDAQVVTGRVLETGTSAPVMWAYVALADTALQPVTETLTDTSGRFSLEAPRPGDYLIIVERLGYGREVDGILELGEGGRLEVEFYISPEAIQLDEVRASVERRQIEAKLDRWGFYERERGGLGQFITPEEIERTRPTDLRDLVRGIPSLRVDDAGGFAGETLWCNNRPPFVWVDGQRVEFMDLAIDGAGDNVILDAVAAIRDIVAVEVYRRASEVPLEFSLTRAADTTKTIGSSPRCVVVVWTKG